MTVTVGNKLSEAEALAASRRTLHMRHHLKSAAVMGGMSLAMLGGCAATIPGPQVRVWCPQGYYLATDYRCWPLQVLPPPNFAASAPPPAAPVLHDSSDNWGRDAAVAAGVVGSVEAGKYAASKLRGAPAVDTGAAAEGTAAGTVETETVVHVAPRVAAPLTAGEGAGAAATVGRAAKVDTLITVIEEGFMWLAEHPYVLLESYKSTSPKEPWRTLVRGPVYTAGAEQRL